MINKQGGVPKRIDLIYDPAGSGTVVRCRIGGVGKVHWHVHPRSRHGYMYGDPTFWTTLCGKEKAQQCWGPDLRKLTLKDVCRACEKALVNLRAAERTQYNKTHDEEGNPLPVPTPQQRAAAVKAKALARPKKRWQPAKKQRSFRVAKRKPKGRAEERA